MGFHARECTSLDLRSPRSPRCPSWEQDGMGRQHSFPSIERSNTNNNNTNNTRDTLQLPAVTPRLRHTSRRTTTSLNTRQTETPDIDLEDIEDSVKPVYLRESSVYNAYVKQKEKQLENEELTNNTSLSDPLSQSKEKWKVCDPDLNAWRENTIDSRNLYSVSMEDVTALSSDEEYDDYPYDDDDDQEVRFLGHIDDPSSATIVDLERLPGDVTHQRERSYIMESRGTNRSPELADARRFWAQTIKEFNRPTQKDVTTSYCSPKNSLVRQKSNDFPKRKKNIPVEAITRVPPHLRILPRLLRGGAMCRKKQCSGKQFCDVLGPETCMSCIEFANRRVAGEVQRQAFPGLDCTVSTLVAPNLSQCLVGGSASQGRRSTTGNGSKKSSISRGVAKTGAFTTRLPTITERVHFGRAGVERNWEEKARRFSSSQPMPPMFLM